ncbi:MAG: hypothetical protein E6Q97_30015 [Desulfurellales bacterium]|nr:MAG: hypothetical protein E6Q97_30015 [Desulfurellales bacterium]
MNRNQQPSNARMCWRISAVRCRDSCELFLWYAILGFMGIRSRVTSLETLLRQRTAVTSPAEALALLPHQASLLADAARARFRVLACGRQWGKTTFGLHQIISAARHGQRVGWCAPIYRQLTNVWHDLLQHLAPTAERVSVQERQVRVRGGGIVECWSLDHPDAVRGRTYDLVIIDEAAMVRDLDRVWHAVIRPTLIARTGCAWFLSTPRGYSWFRTAWEWGQGADPEWISWQRPSSDNSTLPPSEIETARQTSPDRIFAQEYLAPFLADGAVFRHVLELATLPAELPPQPGHTYLIGADWAGTGGSGDYTVFVVVDTTTREVVAVDRFSGVSYALQRQRLFGLYDRYQVEAVYAERNAMGEPVIEELYGAGMRVYGLTTTNASKARWVDALALSLEQRTITLLQYPPLLAELQAFHATRLPGGAYRYSAPDGQHDDCVMALLLAWQGVGVPRGSGLFGILEG